MTTHSDISQIGPYWWGRPEAEIREAAATRDETWAQVPGFAKYEWSDKGRVRPVGWRVDRPGEALKTKVSNSGYEQVNVVNDDRRRVTVSVHVMVLLAHHPAFCGLDRFPDDLETRHNPVTGPLFNAYPEGLFPGTRLQNAADRPEPGGRPTFPCRNSPACGNLVINEGRRCLDCVEEVRRQAAAQLTAGVPLAEVAAGFGNSEGWIYRLALEGGYTGTMAQARGNRPAHERCDCPDCQRRRRGPWWKRITHRDHTPAAAGPSEGR